MLQTTPSKLQLRAAAASRPSPHHVECEDAWQIYEHDLSRGDGLFVVCDGVSTARAGLAAAKLACTRLGQFEEPGAHRHTDTLAQLVSEIDWELRGTNKHAKCTLAMTWVDGSVAHVFTVGDSPVYRLRQGRARQAGAERTGTFRRLAAFLGMGPAVSEVLTMDRWVLQAGDVLMLMSDGVLEALDEDDLAEIWQRDPAPEPCAGNIIAEVARVGVDDDATVIVVEVQGRPGVLQPHNPFSPPDPPAWLSRTRRQ
jgi:serine/threonine protein phosphatase PrpC